MLAGLHLYRTPPRGTSFYSDIRVAFPTFNPRIIFDVGANIGQSTAEYLKAFPDAEIYAFEPSAAYFILKDQYARNARVHGEKIALSDRSGEAKFQTVKNSVISHISPEGNEIVQTETLDAYCKYKGINHIDFLKIDTEGHDLAVLQGADSILSGQFVDMVQVEASMNPDNANHSRFEDLKLLLEGRGYRLFGLYEQAREFPTSQQYLRRTNPVFISKELCNAAVSGSDKPIANNPA